MSSAFTAALAAMKTVIEGVSGITTVFAQVPAVLPTGSELPAVMIHVKPSEVGMARSRVREIIWAVDLIVVTSTRSHDIATDLPQVYDFPELIIAALDTHSGLNGTIEGSVRYGQPAISAENDDAFGMIAGSQEAFVGTTIRTFIHVTRTGGFSA